MLEVGFELPWEPTGSEAARVHASLHEVQQQLERVEDERATPSRESRDSVRYHCFFVQQCDTLLQSPLPAEHMLWTSSNHTTAAAASLWQEQYRVGAAVLLAAERQRQVRLLRNAEEAMVKLAEPSTTTAVDDMPTAADTNSGVDRDNGSDGEVDMFVGGGIDLADEIIAEDGE